MISEITQTRDSAESKLKMIVEVVNMGSEPQPSEFKPEPNPSILEHINGNHPNNNNNQNGPSQQTLLISESVLKPTVNHLSTPFLLSKHESRSQLAISSKNDEEEAF